MNNTLRKRSNSSVDPKNYEETVVKLKLFADLGFTNASFLYSKEPKDIRESLEKEFKVTCFTKQLSKKKFLLEIEW
jgi:hypothetical protein